MEISGKVVAVLEPQSYVSKKDGNTYVTNIFVIETQGQYAKKVAFKVLGDERFKQMGVTVGKNYNVSFDVESREWNGKWFTECSAWKTVCLDGQQQPQAQANTSIPQANTSPVPPLAQENANNGGGGEQEKDDLPF